MLAFTAHTAWNPEGEESFAKGDHVVESPSDNLVAMASAAHAAGVLDVTEGYDAGAVESQEESERKLAEAMGTWHPSELQPDGTSSPGFWDGPWYEGHLAAQEQTLIGRGVAESVIDVEPAEE